MTGRSAVHETGRVVVLAVHRAEGFVERARGLLFRGPLPPSTGLALPQTRCVHGFGIRRSLDLLFIDGTGVVVDIQRLVPWHVKGHRRARVVIELEEGAVVALDIRIGDRIVLVDPGSWPGRRWRPPALRALVTVAGLSCAMTGSPTARADGAALPPAWVDRFAERAEALYRTGADEEAVAAYATLLHVDPGAAAIVILRTGNIHQRKGREWQAIEQYRRALDVDARAGDERQQDARRKALTNLAMLLDTLSRRVAEAIEPRSLPTTAPTPSPRTATPRVAPAVFAGASDRRPATPSPSEPVLPRVEYLGGR